MDSFQNPVTPPDPYDRYRIEPTERERESRSQGGWGGPPDDKKGLVARLLRSLHRILSRILETPRQEKTAVAIAGSLRSLKAAFEILKREDRSEDIQFLNHISQIWLHLLEEGLTLTRATPAGEGLKEFIKKIEHYPAHQSHTFGYYLSEFAGQKWIPFPYMDLIQQLHEEHLKSPEISVLTEWTRLLDTLLLQVE